MTGPPSHTCAAEGRGLEVSRDTQVIFVCGISVVLMVGLEGGWHTRWDCIKPGEKQQGKHVTNDILRRWNLGDLCHYTKSHPLL